MPALAISRGTQVILDNAAYTVRGAMSPDAPIMLERDTDGFTLYMTHAEMTEAILAGRMSVIYPVGDTPSKELLEQRLEYDLATLPAERRQDVARRLAYLKELREAGLKHFRQRDYAIAIPRIAQKLLDSKPPSPITLYRWQADLEAAGGDCRALIPLTKRRGNRTRRICPEASQVVRDVIQRRYLTKDKDSISSVHSTVLTEIQKINRTRELGEKIRIPSRATFYRHIQRLAPYEVALRREGKRAADIKYGARGRGIVTSRILERVEIDHCLVDIFIIDTETFLVLGRPWLTLAIDHHSRMPVGFYLSFDAPSWHSVMRCIGSMVDPKLQLNALYPDMDGKWEAYGLPETLAVDNGKEFHSQNFEHSCSTLGIAVEYMPPRKPWFKGSIERLFRTLNQKLLAGKPGYVVPLDKKSSEFDPEKHAVLQLAEFEEIFVRWIATVYSKSYHKTLRASPADVWKKGLEVCTPRTPTKRIDLEVAMMRTAERVLQHYGVEINNLRYNSEELGALRQRHGNNLNVLVRYSTEDMGKILVTYEAAGVTVEVPALDHDYAAGLPLSAHRVILAYKHRQYIESNNQMSLAAAKEALWARIREIQQSPQHRSKRKLVNALRQRIRQDALNKKSNEEDRDDQQVIESGLTPSPLNTGEHQIIEDVEEFDPDDWGVINTNAPGSTFDDEE